MIERKYVEISFENIYNEMSQRGQKVIEKEVYIGKKEKFKTRLIIHIMSRKEIAKRIRQARANNRKNGHTLSKEHLARIHLNLFISNAKSEVIPMKHVWKLYQMRWQIELAFKIWKSICHIEKVKKVKQHRLGVAQILFRELLT